jgi:broad specificity phosphatase PhoE
MRLILVRHGVTIHTEEQRYSGYTDVPLTTHGLAQARALAIRLANLPFATVISSDVPRTQMTAAIIAETHNVPVQYDSDLRELSMGAWEGLTHEEIIERSPDHLEQWLENPLRIAPPSGETIIQMRDRLAIALDRWYACYPEGTIAWVTHGGSIGILLCHILGMELVRRWQFHTSAGSVSELEINLSTFSNVTSRLFGILLRFNDTAHLDNEL